MRSAERPLRVAVFTSKYPARVASFFERDLRGLIDAGVEVEVFSIYPLDEELWRFCRVWLDEARLPRRRLHHLGAFEAVMRLAAWRPHGWRRFARDTLAVTAAAARFGPVPLAKTAYVLPKAWAWALAHGDRFDHVLAYWGNYAGTCAYAFHRLLGRPIPFSIWLHAGTDLYYQPIFLREKLAYADNVFTCCEFNRDFLQQAHGADQPSLAAKIHVCYHGLDLATFPFTPDGRHPRRVLAVGRLVSDKGFDYLLRAAHLLLARGIELEVEIVGDGEERRRLEGLARTLNIADRVRFPGWLSFEGVRRAMQEATMLVHPSEGLGDALPNVVGEAMALGAPVVATSVAGLVEALDHGRGGILVPSRDPPALAEAVETLLFDGDRRRALALAGRLWVEKHLDGPRNGEHLARVLRGTAHRGHRQRAALGPHVPC
ncbi:MAG: glycosyltransferase [Gemmatimonadetes bacterium]|nr:glycosyltransferase [Gemmatimonadota bacterium]